jgi:hypothetical protein
VRVFMDRDAALEAAGLSEFVDIGHREVIVDSTGAPAHGGLEKAEDAIRADALQALDGQPEVRPSILDIGEKAPNAASAFVGTLDLGGRRKQLDVLRATSKVAVDVSLIQGGNGPLHHLDVLLRHRLRSIRRIGPPKQQEGRAIRSLACPSGTPPLLDRCPEENRPHLHRLPSGPGSKPRGGS